MWHEVVDCQEDSQVTSVDLFFPTPSTFSKINTLVCATWSQRIELAALPWIHGSNSTIASTMLLEPSGFDFFSTSRAHWIVCASHEQNITNMMVSSLKKTSGLVPLLSSLSAYFSGFFDIPQSNVLVYSSLILWSDQCMRWESFIHQDTVCAIHKIL